jgi:hypothetical protein
MNATAYGLRQGATSDEARQELVRRLLPSVHYEIAQITTAISINTAATSRWLASDPQDLDEAHATEGRSRLLVRGADRLMRAVVRLGDAGPRGSMPVDPAALAQVAVQMTRRAAHGLGTTLRLELGPDLPSVQADPVSALHLVLELLLELADASVPLVDVAGRRDDETVVLTIKARGTDVAALLAQRSKTFERIPHGVAVGVPAFSIVAQGVELVLPVSPPPSECEPCQRTTETWG